MDDSIQKLLRELLATEDPVEFDTLSAQLRSLLHERIEKLRKEAAALKPRASERRKRPRNGEAKP